MGDTFGEERLALDTEEWKIVMDKEKSTEEEKE